MEHSKTTNRSGRHLYLLLLIGLVIILVAWVARATLSSGKPGLGDKSLRDLIAGLAEDEQTAGEAQELLEKLPQAKELNFWKPLLHSSNPNTRYVAAENIAKVKTPEAAQILAGLLTDSSSVVRIQVVQSLPFIDKEIALRPLLAALRDDDLWVRQEAARQIQYLHDKRAVPMLIAALRDLDRYVGVQSMSNLRRLTGMTWRARNIDPDAAYIGVVRRWEEWWKAARANWKVDASLVNVAPIHPTRKDRAPDFRVRTVQGDWVSLSDLRGKLVLINFWATWCKHCHAEMKDLEKLKQQYGPQGLEVMGLEIGESEEEPLRKYAAEHAITYPLALTPEPTRKAYGHVFQVPASFLIDREGFIRYHWDGERDGATFSAAVSRLLTER
jgi:peroxiredoxin